jgi:CheY-like chemotaxis protein
LNNVHAKVNDKRKSADEDCGEFYGTAPSWFRRLGSPEPKPCRRCLTFDKTGQNIFTAIARCRIFNAFKETTFILLVDDEYLEIMFLADTLEKDYEVIFASDGRTALESAGRNMPDMILLDAMMPGIDGFEVCRQLKADNQTKEIPVIFITGLGELAAETKGLHIGAVDYITKPFHPAQLRVGANAYKRKTARES